MAPPNFYRAQQRARRRHERPWSAPEKTRRAADPLRWARQELRRPGGDRLWAPAVLSGPSRALSCAHRRAWRAGGELSLAQEQLSSAPSTSWRAGPESLARHGLLIEAPPGFLSPSDRLITTGPGFLVRAPGLLTAPPDLLSPSDRLIATAPGLFVRAPRPVGASPGLRSTSRGLVAATPRCPVRADRSLDARPGFSSAPPRSRTWARALAAAPFTARGRPGAWRRAP